MANRQPTEKKKKKKKTRLFSAPLPWYIVTLLTYGALSLPFILFNTLDFNSNEEIAGPLFNSPRTNNQLLFYHIILAIPACLFGPLMFHEQFRNNYLWWHRQLGKIYIICCCASAALGFLLAFGKAGGLMSAGFATLGALWFYTTYTAYRRARQRNFRSHRRWMLRSFALTFAFVTVKFWNYGLGAHTNFSEELSMTIKSWSAWVPNLIFIETYIWSTSHRSKWIGLFQTFPRPPAAAEATTALETAHQPTKTQPPAQDGHLWPVQSPDPESP